MKLHSINGVSNQLKNSSPHQGIETARGSFFTSDKWLKNSSPHQGIETLLIHSLPKSRR